VHPTLRSGSSLHYLRTTRVVHTYGDRYFLPAKQAELALSTLPSQESDGSTGPLTKEDLRRRGVDYFRSRRQERPNAIGELWPQLGEIELLMRTHDWDESLALMNDIDDAYLSRWGQSHVLVSWREELKGSLERPESRGSNLSYLRAAMRQHDGHTLGLEDITEALGLARSLDDRKNVIVTTVQLANLLVERGELTEAMRHYRHAIDESQLYGQLVLEVRARTGLATCAAKRGDFDRAEQEMNKVATLNDELHLSERADDLRASQLINQAWLRGQRGDYVTARRLLLEAQELAQRSCNDRRRAWVLGGLAANALAMGASEQAIRLGGEGARIADRLDNHRLLREINAIQGFAFLAVGDLASAAAVANRAAGHGSKVTAVSVWNLTGLVAFRRRGRDADARTAFLSATRSVQQRNQGMDDYQLLDAEGLAYTGLALLDDAAPDEALRAFGQARNLTRAAGVLAHNAFLLGLFGKDVDEAVLSRIRVAASSPQ